MKEPTPGKQLSFWIDTTPRTNFPTLKDDTAVDVAILGGGIVGLTAAVLLKRLGKTVAVIEARRVAEGVTGHTTAKVTSQHRLIYDTLIKEHGEHKARLYGEALALRRQRLQRLSFGISMLNILISAVVLILATYARAG
jgi:glycine/D-amino acid oxidase-like deaminating enzyme